ncbi:hypothetical protein H2200_002072 [Cladophialophora chaetospira]|uniref:Uncharacterized protein n=1 Tax=Cladophialophora chaetospira TaxID=386627 RepID=A0AA38XIA2_9EURO|nr:hypothetical protein H2200_002072 [Cladophialophora chaetospira]
MPSQGPQPLSSQLSPLCLPLLKFSYATVSNDNIVPIPWIHLSSKNALFAIFETSPVQLDDGRTEERQKFKVLKDPEIMEELDLNALSAEAHRVLAHEPAGPSANIPVVAVIVKVPMIAIKYPLANGQVRRFQIRFGKNEDYYEAMKMLARANVPTVEAGTFPSLKPPQVPQAPAPPPNLVAPDESASQIGGETNQPNNRASNDGMPSVSLARRAPAGLTGMGPPQMFSTSVNRAQDVSGHAPTIGLLHTSYPADTRPAYPKSNISLSTATTLVAGKQDSRSYALRPQNLEMHGSRALREQIPQSIQQPTELTPTQLPRIPLPPQEVVYDLPPSRQEVPLQSVEQDVQVSQYALRTTRNTTSRSQADQAHAQPAEIDEPEPTAKTTAKGKGKRAAPNNTKKAPAAKKPRATAPAKKKGKAAQIETTVPTVEELLRQPGYSLLPYNPSTTARTMPRAPRINQKAGFEQSKRQDPEIPESEYGAENLNLVSPELGHALPTRVTRSRSRALSQVLPTELNIRAQETSISRSAAPPCTPADQIIGSPLTPASPAFQPHISPTKPPGQPPGKTTSFNLPNINPTPLPSDPLLSLAQQCMTVDPAYDLSNSTSRTEAWHSLPGTTRTTAMNHYLCDLLMHDWFTDLCKGMDLHLAGAILEGRVLRASMDAGVCREEVDEEEEL